MANIPDSFQENNVFQGPAIVYLGAYSFNEAGSTPSEIGGVMEVSMETSFEVVELKLGWPRVLMKQYIKEKNVQVSFKTVEPADYELLKYALGSASWTTGDTPVTTTHTLNFGEDITQNECSIMLQIVNVEGKTETVYIWKAIGGLTTVTRDYDDEGIHMPTYTFKVLRSTHDWVGGALSEGQRYYRMIFQNEA